MAPGVMKSEFKSLPLQHAAKFSSVLPFQHLPLLDAGRNDLTLWRKLLGLVMCAVSSRRGRYEKTFCFTVYGVCMSDCAKERGYRATVYRLAQSCGLKAAQRFVRWLEQVWYNW